MVKILKGMSPNIRIRNTHDEKYAYVEITILKSDIPEGYSIKNADMISELLVYFAKWSKPYKIYKIDISNSFHDGYELITYLIKYSKTELLKPKNI